MSQTKLEEETEEITSAEVYYREVMDEGSIDPQDKELSKKVQLEQIKELLDYIRNKKLKYPKNLEKSDMGDLEKDKVRHIISEDNIEYPVKDLLTRFCDELTSKQKEKGKYAMLIRYGDNFLLAHAKVETGMSISEDDEEVGLIKRFLDADNILSGALFEKIDEKVQFSHFTDTGSSSFRNFIGVKEKRYNFRRKNIQIITYYSGEEGLPCKFEFSNDTLEKKWLKNENIEITSEYIQVNGDRKHRIKEIKWGNKTFSTPNKFKAEFKEHVFGLEHEKRTYNRLKKMDEFAPYYEKNEAVDQKREVQIRNTEEETTKIEDKGELPEEVFSIFANTHIDVDPSFAEKIVMRLHNGSEIKIYHASEKPASNNLEIDNWSFLNIEESSVPNEMMSFLENLKATMADIQGETVNRQLALLFLHTVNRKMPGEAQDGIEKIIKKEGGIQSDQKLVSTKENEGNGIIEYKDRDDLDRGDPADSITDVVKNEDIQNGKVIIWGINEEKRTIEGLRKGRFGDDRVSAIEGQVIDNLDDSGKSYSDFYLRSVPIDEKGESLVLVATVY